MDLVGQCATLLVVVETHFLVAETWALLVSQAIAVIARRDPAALGVKLCRLSAARVTVDGVTVLEDVEERITPMEEEADRRVEQDLQGIRSRRGRMIVEMTGDGSGGARVHRSSLREAIRTSDLAGRAAGLSPRWVLYRRCEGESTKSAQGG